MHARNAVFSTLLFDMHKTTFHLNPSYIPEQAKRLSRNSEQGCHNPPQYFKQRLTSAVSNMNLIRQRTEGKGSQDLTSVKTSFWSVESSLQHQTVYIQRAVCVTLCVVLPNVHQNKLMGHLYFPRTDCLITRMGLGYTCLHIPTKSQNFNCSCNLIVFCERKAEIAKQNIGWEFQCFLNYPASLFSVPQKNPFHTPI